MHASTTDALCVSIAGWGTNEKLIISILAHRNAAQRRAIRRAYAEAYGKELLRALGDEIHGKFEVGDRSNGSKARAQSIHPLIGSPPE